MKRNLIIITIMILLLLTGIGIGIVLNSGNSHISRNSDVDKAAATEITDIKTKTINNDIIDDYLNQVSNPEYRKLAQKAFDYLEEKQIGNINFEKNPDVYAYEERNIYTVYFYTNIKNDYSFIPVSIDMDTEEVLGILPVD